MPISKGVVTGRRQQLITYLIQNGINGNAQDGIDGMFDSFCSLSCLMVSINFEISSSDWS